MLKEKWKILAFSAVGRLLHETFFSRFLVLVLLLNLMSVPVFGSEKSQDINLDSGDVRIEGTNSFGNLISDVIQTEQNSQETNTDDCDPSYSVSDLVIQGNKSSVTYSTMETAFLVVALYSEDGMHLLCSATAEVDPDAKTAEVTFSQEMPEYFLASAYFLDVYDLSPLCPNYDTPMYTRDMQELLSMSVEDCIEEYGEERSIIWTAAWRRILRFIRRRSFFCRKLKEPILLSVRMMTPCSMYFPI